MTKLECSKTLPYSSDDLFTLVMDINSYPEFLPWCKDAKIISKTIVSKKETQEETHFIADLTIQFKVFSYKYRSKIIAINQIDQNLKQEEGSISTIDITAINGPFKYLKSSWVFKQDKQHVQQSASKTDSTLVQFALSFEFSSLLLQTLISPLFKQASKKIIDAFEKRSELVLKSSQKLSPK